MIALADASGKLAQMRHRDSKRKLGPYPKACHALSVRLVAQRV